MPDELDQAAYIRAIEDFFATARGVQHLLSPKDVQLVLTWWNDEVPLAAISAGIAEVFAKRSDGDGDPTVSLTYCRHAVGRQARHFAEMHAGDREAADEGTESGIDVAASLGHLVASLDAAAAGVGDRQPAVAEVIRTISQQVAQASELAPAALDEHLFALQSTLLEGCLRALDEDERQAIDEQARTAAAASGALGGALERMTRAMIDRQLRQRLELPLLALD